MSVESNFRKQLKLYLQFRGLSASDISRQTNVPKQTISGWLAGTRPRNMEFVKRVADAMGVSITALFFGHGIEISKDDEAIDAFKKSSSAEQRAFLNLFTETGELRGAQANYRDERSLILRAGTFFFSHTEELVQVRGLRGFPVELSDSWETALGWPLNEIKQKRWFEWIHPDDRSVTLSAIEAFGVGRQPIGKCSHRLIHKSGRWIPFDTMFFVDLEAELIFTLSRPLKQCP